MNAVLGRFISELIPRVQRVHGRNRLATLIYHRVLPKEDYMRPYEVTAEQFDWQMALISKFFNPVTVAEGLSGLRDGTLPKNAVCVTFDDGYADNLDVALPLLKKHSVPAAVFVSTDYLNGGRMWNDTILESFREFDGNEVDLTDIGLSKYQISSESDRYDAAVSVLTEVKHWATKKRAFAAKTIGEKAESLPEDLMLNDSQVVELSKSGIEIGAHTCSHPILSNLDRPTSRKEIFEPKQYLEKLIAKEVRYFAYPNGRPDLDYKELHVRLVKDAGYHAAFSTTWGVSDRTSDIWQLARFTPWDSSPMKFMLRLLANYRNVIS